MEDRMPIIDSYNSAIGQKQAQQEARRASNEWTRQLNAKRVGKLPGTLGERMTPGTLGQQLQDVMREGVTSITQRNIPGAIGHAFGTLGQQFAQTQIGGSLIGLNNRLSNETNRPMQLGLTYGQLLDKQQGGRVAAWDKQNLTPQEWRALQDTYNNQVNAWTDANGVTWRRTLNYSNPGEFIIEPDEQVATEPPPDTGGGWGGGGGGGGGSYFDQWRQGLMSWTGI
jgi:hypothetical protein